MLSDISEKTNKELSVSLIDLSITEGLSIHNIFFEDANNDTLIFAKKIEVQFNLLNYFSDKLSVTKLEINNATVKITSNADSIFNFQYIIDEFSGNTNTDNKDTLKSEIPINLNNIDIVFDNVNFVFSSTTGGINLQVRDVDLILNTDSIDINKMKYYANNIDVKNANIGIELSETKPSIDTPNLTTDAETYLQKIKKEKQIPQLEIYQLKAIDFRADNFKILQDFKAEADAKAKGHSYTQSIEVSIPQEMPPTTISTPEQLDEYIETLRAKLMVKLKKNIKLYLK